MGLGYQGLRAVDAIWVQGLGYRVSKQMGFTGTWFRILGNLEIFNLQVFGINEHAIGTKSHPALPPFFLAATGGRSLMIRDHQQRRLGLRFIISTTRRRRLRRRHVHVIREPPEALEDLLFRRSRRGIRGAGAIDRQGGLGQNALQTLELKPLALAIQSYIYIILYTKPATTLLNPRA